MTYSKVASNRRTIAAILIGVIVVAGLGAYYTLIPKAGIAQTATSATQSTTSSVQLTTSSYFPDLVSAAQKEGSVTVYTSETAAVYDGLSKAWAAKYPGIQLNLIHDSADVMAAKLIAEYQGGKVTADALSMSKPYLPPFKAMGALAPYCARNSSNIAREYLQYGDPSCYWQPPIEAYPITVLYNKELVDPSLLPADRNLLTLLNDPKAQSAFKGKFSMPTPTQASMATWLVSMQTYYPDNQTWQTNLLQKLKNLQPSYTSGGQASVQTVISGQNLLAWGQLAHTRSLGANNLDYLDYEPMLSNVQLTALLTYAPHPNAAKLYIEFTFSPEAQLAIAQGYGIALAVGAKQVLPVQNLHIVVEVVLDDKQLAAWQKFFQNFFGLPG